MVCYIANVHLSSLLSVEKPTTQSQCYISSYIFLLGYPRTEQWSQYAGHVMVVFQHNYKMFIVGWTQCSNPQPRWIMCPLYSLGFGRHWPLIFTKSILVQRSISYAAASASQNTTFNHIKYILLITSIKVILNNIGIEFIQCCNLCASSIQLYLASGHVTISSVMNILCFFKFEILSVWMWNQHWKLVVKFIIRGFGLCAKLLCTLVHSLDKVQGDKVKSLQREGHISLLVTCVTLESTAHHNRIT